MELAAQGHNILIAVPSGDIAKEHKTRIERLGGSAHLLQSHKAIFKGRELECPDYDPIQYLYNLGVDSRYYKSQYCSNCPFKDTCAYPNQYAEATNPEHRIVIIQHAHFQCRETLIHLFKEKTFEVLIVDESFIDNLIETIYPTEFEKECLKSFDFKWTKLLSSWLELGGEPSGCLYTKREELEEVNLAFSNAKEVWRVKDLISCYNQGIYFHHKSGIKRFSPLPYVPIKILTDATPTEEEIKIVLNSDDLEVIGKGDLLDIREYHPDNKVFQVIDSSLSKTSLRKDEKFYELLNFIGEKCAFELKEEKILITTFKDSPDFAWSTETLDYLKLKHPSLDIGTDALVNRVVVDGMKVGVNTYADFHVQFLLASVYMSPGQIATSAYKTKVIANYWRGQLGQSLLQNILPHEIKGIETEPSPVEKITPLGKVAYSKYSLYKPTEKFKLMAYEKNVGKSQQAIRIRFTQKSDKPKQVFILGNYNFPGILVTDPILLRDIL